MNVKNLVKEFFKPTSLKKEIVLVLFLVLVVDLVTYGCGVPREDSAEIPCYSLVGYFAPDLITALTFVPLLAVKSVSPFVPDVGLFPLVLTFLFLVIELIYLYLLSCILASFWVGIRTVIKKGA